MYVSDVIVNKDRVGKKDFVSNWESFALYFKQRLGFQTPSIDTNYIFQTEVGSTKLPVVTNFIKVWGTLYIL